MATEVKLKKGRAKRIYTPYPVVARKSPEQFEFENQFIADVVTQMEDWMQKNGYTREDLVRELGTPSHNIRQMFFGQNPGLRRIAGAVYVMGGKCVFSIEPAKKK